MDQEWALWEVFIRNQAGLYHKHVGSVHASDEKMALQSARDLYVRRNEGESIWVVLSTNIVASDPADTDELFEASKDKVYRHPTFYDLPDDLKHM